MRFHRQRLNDDMDRLRQAADADDRARGDNFAFEDNVGPARLAHFEATTAGMGDLAKAAMGYFRRSVEGARLDHVPSTFEDMNDPALWPSTIEGVQKIVRLERIDGILDSARVDFAALKATVESGCPDDSVVTPLLRGFEDFPGARPSFACFKAEVAVDLQRSDWLERLCQRLGLGHWALADGQTARFALMEYTVAEVFRQTRLTRPFARPTVLECQNSEFFFPTPREVENGYAVDLDHLAGRDSIREFLHVRIKYGIDHLKRIAERTGPTAPVDLPAARAAHLARLQARLKTRCDRSDFGEPMPMPMGECV
jgi:hypothetical protein